MRILFGNGEGGNGASLFGVQALNGDVFGGAVRIGLLLLPTTRIVIGENRIAKVLGAMRIVDLDAVDLDGFGHSAGIAEVVKAVIVGGENAHFDGTVLGGSFFGGPDGRLPDAVAQGQFAVEERAVIGTEIDHAVAEEGGVFDKCLTKANEIDTHVAEGTAFDSAVGYAHVGVESGHDAVLQIKILGKVGAHQPPIFRIGDIYRLPDIQKTDIDNSVHVEVVRAHGNRDTGNLGCGIISLVGGQEAILYRNITALDNRQKTAVRCAVVLLARDKVRDSLQGRVRAGHVDISAVIVIKRGGDVGDGYKDATFYRDGDILSGKGIGLGYGGVIPVDVTCYVPFSVHGKAIGGGNAVVLVGASSDVYLRRIVKNTDIQAFLVRENNVLLSAFEGRDLGLEAGGIRCHAEAGGINVFKLAIIDGEFGRSPSNIGFDDGCEIASANVIIGAIDSHNVKPVGVGIFMAGDNCGHIVVDAVADCAEFFISYKIAFRHEFSPFGVWLYHVVQRSPSTFLTMT